jgi:MraZ protein
MFTSSGFFGQYECKLDDKFRLTIPSRLKSEVMHEEAESCDLILMRGFEPCVYLYTKPDWLRLVHDKVAKLDSFNSRHAMLKRTIMGSCAEVTMDKTGRLLLPKMMIGHAELEKDMLLVGALDRLELWNPDKYTKYCFSDEEYITGAEALLGEKTIEQPANKVFHINIADNSKLAEET